MASSTASLAAAPVWARGSRKNAHCRVRVVPGEGKFLINNRSVEHYFGGHERQKWHVMKPFSLMKSSSSYDVFVDIEGGGVTGQAAAIAHGVAHAFSKVSPAIRLSMRKAGLLTRDDRMVQRKKSGQPKARKRFQFSKR